MLISALCDYYDVLEKKGKLPPEGYEEITISYLIELDISGTIIDIMPCEKNQSIKRYFPRSGKSATKAQAYYVETRGKYLFGLQFEGDVLRIAIDGTSEKPLHEIFKEEVKQDFKSINSPSPLVQAYLNFVEKWNPENEIYNHQILNLKKSGLGKNFGICLAGHPEKLLQDDSDVREVWQKIRNSDIGTDKWEQCCITGEILPVARLHDTIKGVKDASTMGASLINFNRESFLSYGHKQGENGCISTLAMKKYTKALNWLLSDPKHHNYLDGLTLVYWAADANESNDTILQMLLMGNEDKNFSSDEMDQILSVLVQDARNADVSSVRLRTLEENISKNTPYYIFALSPNSSRIQVKFIYRQKFGKILDNIARYQQDISIIGRKKTVPLWLLKNELIPLKILKQKKSSYLKQSDAMFLSVLRSIVQGVEYPSWLLSLVIRQIRADRNQENEDKGTTALRLNAVRAGIIKACIIRHTKEAITMALNREDENPSYLCGRLFAVLQKIQEDSASPQKLNRTIEDSYLSAASANPATIMPRLFRMSQHHMAKLRKTHPDWATIDNKQLNEIIEKLGTSFPGSLSLYDQGRFILGYYQQNASRFESGKGDQKNAET